jgi:hypothetical protein
MTTTGKKVRVSLRALIQRINRQLAKEDEKLCKARVWNTDTGDYYVVDLNRNVIVGQHVDPEVWGRELGVLHPWEVLAEE